MTLPKSFAVGVAAPLSGNGSLRAYGGGRLIIDDNSIVLRIGPVTRASTSIDFITHEGKGVILLKSRWSPPYLNSRLVVSDGQRTCAASFPGWLRRSLRAALLEAGFEIEERYGWSF